MIMVTNNTYDALENLLIDNVKLVKLPNVAPNNTDKVSVTFTVNRTDDTINMILTREEYDDDLGLLVNENKLFKLDPDKDYELMDVTVNHILDTINYILEQMQDKLNECYGIAPLGVTKYKNSNCLEYNN